MKLFLSIVISSVVLVGCLVGGTITFRDNDKIPASELGAVGVSLVMEDGLLVPGEEGKRYELSELEPDALAPTAINEILRAISSFYQEQGILATRAVVTKPAFERSRNGGDLQIVIQEGRITEAKVVSAQGDYQVETSAIDRIKGWVPLGAGDSVDVRRLDETIGQSNRFSRQIVRPVLLPDAGGAIIEYRVKQLNEWAAGYTFDNYGTERTGQTRHTAKVDRWNFLMPNDHIALNGTMSTEGDAWSAGGSYTIPLDEISIDRLKIATYTSVYSAEDVGLGATGIDFEGKSLGFKATYERTLLSHKGAYLDGIVGLHFLQAMQDQSSLGIPEAKTHYLLPSIGLRYAKSGIDSSWTLGAKLEGNLPSLADTDSGADLNRQGRLNASEDFLIGSLYGGYRTYLDKLLGRSGGRAHELSLFGSMTSSLGGDRLPPSFLGVLGGPYSVRGYPIGTLSGDRSGYLKTDYKFHLNRMGGQNSSSEAGNDGGLRPKFAGDMPDFGIALGAFFDIGSVSNEDRINAFESDGTLSSAGLGLTLDFQGKYTLNLEHAWALSEVMTSNHVIESGDAETYLRFSAKW